jgi:hypothetical protein
MSTQNFQSDRSAARMKLIKILLAERAAEGRTFTRADITDATGLGLSSAALYVRQIVAMGLAEMISPAELFGKGGLPAEYAPTTGNAIEVDDCPRRVTVRTTWPLHHIRGPLECALFGVPSAMQIQQ